MHVSGESGEARGLERDTPDMLTKMRNVLRRIWRQAYTSAIAGLPGLSAAEQTKSSWAKFVDSYAAVPNVYKDFFDTILLDSHIKITGVTRQGMPASSAIKFNSVTDYLFEPILARIRLATAESKGAAQGSGIEKF